jgi:hypothetical protein
MVTKLVLVQKPLVDELQLVPASEPLQVSITNLVELQPYVITPHNSLVHQVPLYLM